MYFQFTSCVQGVNTQKIPSYNESILNWMLNDQVKSFDHQKWASEHDFLTQPNVSGFKQIREMQFQS